MLFEQIKLATDRLHDGFWYFGDAEISRKTGLNEWHKERYWMFQDWDHVSLNALNRQGG